MLQCLCGRSLRTSNSLSGETVFSPRPSSSPSLLLASLPSPPLFRGVSGGGGKAFPCWDQMMAPPRVVFLFKP